MSSGGEDWDELAIWTAVLLVGGVLVRKATEQIREAGTRIVVRQLLDRDPPRAIGNRWVGTIAADLDGQSFRAADLDHDGSSAYGATHG